MKKLLFSLALLLYGVSLVTSQEIAPKTRSNAFTINPFLPVVLLVNNAIIKEILPDAYSVSVGFNYQRVCTNYVTMLFTPLFGMSYGPDLSRKTRVKNQKLNIYLDCRLI
jgi:predicted solute-binding protein